MTFVCMCVPNRNCVDNIVAAVRNEQNLHVHNAYSSVSEKKCVCYFFVDVNKSCHRIVLIMNNKFTDMNCYGHVF